MSGWLKNIDYMLLDLVWLHIAFIAAYNLRFPGAGLPYSAIEYRNLVLVMSFIQLLLSMALGNLSNVSKRGLMYEFISVALLSFSMLAVSTLYLFAVKSSVIYSRLFTLYLFVALVLINTAGRLIWKYLLKKKIVVKKLRRQHSRSALIVADTAENAMSLALSMENDELRHYVVKGFVLPEEKGAVEIPSIPVMTNFENALEYICREWIDEVFISASPKAVSREFLECCAEMGLTVHSLLNLHDDKGNRQFIENIGDCTCVTTVYNYIAMYQMIIKRLMDIVGGLIGSLFAVLIGIIIGPIIYINSPGPIIFRQKRIGKNGKPFYVLKFRSMYLDAEDRKKTLMTENRVSDGMMFKMDFDPRVIGNKVLPDGSRKTGIGEFIRKTSLDEFPQFFNVLKGDMSLVGTRPPTVDEWEKYKYHHRARLVIRPGITGMWQVSGRSEITDFEEVVRLDTEYIMNYRLLLDIKILFKTVFVLLKRKGAM